MSLYCRCLMVEALPINDNIGSLGALLSNFPSHSSNSTRTCTREA